MKTSFTTLGCPAWDLETIIAQGSSMGFDGVDFRGLQDDIDITQLSAFTTDIATTKTKFADAGLHVCGISSSLKVCDDTKVDDNLEEAKRTIPVAAELGTETIRVFGGGDAQRHSHQQMADIGQQLMLQVLDLDGAGKFKWVFETHDNWIRSTDCKLLLERVTVPEFGALWDMGHTSRVGGEDPADSLAALGERVYYLHVKDAIYDESHERAMQDGWRYVPPGTGELPIGRALELLQGRDYTGYVMFEHEKRWHGELEEPEQIFPMFLEWFRGLGL
ncbi:MAG: sugar phosphate isomerase/epimerase [Candidatus Latescibacterota bacterium]|jgi:sugar phosphate isomerase/epimerase